ncbi:carotenoid oxygenase family protein [Bacillus swezeyi]|uniref:carotenoid oxygenase family protein n=1 Tax=Bacillus swezeyi TaxID=1925020 RepID=UPI0039C6348B
MFAIDDDWKLAAGYDPERNASEIVMLEAADFDDDPGTRIKLDHRVPLGFQGNCIPAQ